MDYYKKYLKYKNKYLKYKEQIGGTYSNLVYLGEGAESIVFRMENGRALKIIKDPSKFISDKERDIINKLSTLGSSNFPTIDIIGVCNSLIPPKPDTKEFCITGSDGVLYQYIIMDTIKGQDMMNIYYDMFKDYVNQDTPIDFTSETYLRTENEYINLVLNVSLKIIRALKLAHERFCFRHNDLDFRNCLILEDNTPVIIDFGQSEIDKRGELQCKDINAFLNSVLKNTYCNSSSVLNKKYPDLADGLEKTKIINNCKLIFNNINKNVKVIDLMRFKNNCSSFLGTDISFDDYERELSRLLS